MEDCINLKVIIGLRRAVNALGKYDFLAVKESGLTMTQFGVLERLHHKGN